jgi:alpha-1,4-glucan:alpha-1,4-glucan 6-glycosyltransferase
MGILTQQNVNDILGNNLNDPFGVLGMHWEQPGVSVRVYAPEARSIDITRAGADESLCSMTRMHDAGIFEAVFPEHKEFFTYELLMTLHDGGTKRQRDPYSFLPVMSEDSRYLFNEGNHYRAYDDLGSHVREIDHAKGVVFAVWAPNAKRISVVGQFNNWDGRRHPMRCLGTSGVWELFIPDLDNGTVYKYEIKKRDRDHLILKTDPYGYYQEPPPNHASIVFCINGFKWNDQKWMKAREEKDQLNSPMSIYEVHLGSWRKTGPREDGDYLSYHDLADQLARYVREMGFTHIELLPVQDHPYVPSWGYQVGGFYAPNHRFGTPADFQCFVDYMHQQGIGVIMDWVPGHFPKDAYGLAHFDGTHLYEYQDPREGEHKDWGTLIFNFGRNEVKNFLVANALFWLENFHIDGLRVDAVASMLYRNYSRKDGEWIPNKYGGVENQEAVAFLQSMNKLVHQTFPGAVTIAEESTAWAMVSRPTYSGGLGFTFKWNMGWMNDILSYFSKDPVYRKFHQNQLTFGLMYAFTENFVLVVSHDEVVHGKKSLFEKMPGDRWNKFANVRAFLGFMFGHPGKKLLFQGCEFAMHWEWNAQQSINWHILDKEDDRDFHRGIQKLVSDINNLYRREPALWERDFEPEGFSWIDFSDADNSVISFMRFGKDVNASMLVVACNLTPTLHQQYRIGVPFEGFYQEVLNTDSTFYCGAGNGNMGGKNAEAIPLHNQKYSLDCTLPSLSTVIFKWMGEKKV